VLVTYVHDWAMVSDLHCWLGFNLCSYGGGARILGSKALVLSKRLRKDLIMHWLQALMASYVSNSKCNVGKLTYPIMSVHDPITCSRKVRARFKYAMLERNWFQTSWICVHQTYPFGIKIISSISDMILLNINQRWSDHSKSLTLIAVLTPKMKNLSLNIKSFPSNLLLSCISLEPLKLWPTHTFFIGLKPLINE